MIQPGLFGDEPTPAVEPRRARTAGWEITDHACRHCMGRVLVRIVKGINIVRCAECGAEENGEVGHDALCYCGVKVGPHGAMFECFRNTGSAAPQEVLVRERKVEKAAPKRGAGNPMGGSW